MTNPRTTEWWDGYKEVEVTESKTTSDIIKLEALIRKIHSDGFAAGIHHLCFFPFGHLNKYLDHIREIFDVKKSKITDQATLRDKMYRDLIVPMFDPKWSVENHERVLELLIQYRKEIERDCY